MDGNNTNKIIQSRNEAKRAKTRRIAIITAKNNRYVPMPKKDEIILSVGNMDLRVINGKLQIKSREGVAHLRTKKGSDFTTTSTTWIDVSGLPQQVEVYPILKQKQTKLKRILSSLEKSKDVLKKIAKNSPLELEWVDIDFGIIKARFKPKKKEKK